MFGFCCFASAERFSDWYSGGVTRVLGFRVLGFRV